MKESVRGKRVFGGDVSLTAGTSGWMTDRDGGWGGLLGTTCVCVVTTSCGFVRLL